VRKKPAPPRPTIRRKPQPMSAAAALYEAAKALEAFDLRQVKPFAKQLAFIAMDAAAVGLLIAIIGYAVAVVRYA
jgi:hypothetical protein